MSSMTLTVEEVGRTNELDRQRWDSYVRDHPEGTFFHLIGWQTVIQSVFGHRTFYLAAKHDDRVVGVLPLAYVKSAVFGNYLISTPFCVYGGAVADSEEIARSLIEHACELADELEVQALELRNRSPRSSSWPVKELYYTFRKEMTGDDDVNLAAIPRKQRAMVRKGIGAGLQGTVEKDVEPFYGIYSESVRNLGTPVYGKKYFRKLQSVFGDDCEIRVIRHGEEPVAAVMSFYFRDEVLPYYGGSRPIARQLKGNDFMYWNLMSAAASRGARIFDFGRSKADTGPFSFKKNWGFEPQPLPYEFYLVRATELPRVDPTNPKYERLVNLWKRLPLPFANTVGPLIARSLG